MGREHLKMLISSNFSLQFTSLPMLMIFFRFQIILIMSLALNLWQSHTSHFRASLNPFLILLRRRSFLFCQCNFPLVPTQQMAQEFYLVMFTVANFVGAPFWTLSKITFVCLLFVLKSEEETNASWNLICLTNPTKHHPQWKTKWLIQSNSALLFWPQIDPTRKPSRIPKLAPFSHKKTLKSQDG